jgi:DNA (cytosine-5)-methyltransferase 1
MARIVHEVQPRFVLVENSPLLVGRGLNVVLADLASMGFDAEWGVVAARDVDAPHQRDRIWIVAHAG